MSETPLLMPKLGLTMTEGLLESWRFAAGDKVLAGQVVFVVETDKIATEVEAETDCVLASILVPAGETVPVGAVLGTVSSAQSAGAGSAPAPAAPPPPATAEVAASPKPAPLLPSAPDGRVLATPLARRQAKLHGVDLSALVGSGPRGRIKADDIASHLAALPATPAAARPGSPLSLRQPGSVERAVARRLTQSKQTIPHFYVLAEADVTDLMALRKQLNADDGRKITVNHLILAAAAQTLRAFPEFNAVWTDEGIATLAAADIGFAVDTAHGLFAPVLRNAGALGLDELVAASDLLIETARNGKLAGDDLAGGAMSVSNVGMYGAAFLVPIINPGQSTILGVGSIKPVFRPDAHGAPVLRQQLGLTLSCDHRVLDGVRAARFLNAVTQRLEAPLRILRNA